MHPLHSYVYGIVSVLAVLYNAVCPFFIAWGAKKKKYLLVIGALLLWLLCIAFAVTSALGFAAYNRYTSTSSQQTLNVAYQEAQQRLADLEATRANFQRTPTRLENRIDAVREELQDLRTKGALKPNDPQARLISDLTDVPESAVKTALIVLFGIIIEVGASLGLYISLAHGNFGPKRKRSPPKPKQWKPKVIK